MYNRKDKDDLNKAILQYLNANGYYNTVDLFAEEASLDASDMPKTSNILEMKWKSVVRLKKQVMELE
jgi:hypothetical protein